LISFTTKITARLRRNQSGNLFFTTGDTGHEKKFKNDENAKIGLNEIK